MATITVKQSGSNFMVYSDANEQRGCYALLCPANPEQTDSRYYKVVVAFGCNLDDFSDEGTRAEVYNEHDYDTALSIAVRFLTGGKP